MRIRQHSSAIKGIGPARTRITSRKKDAMIFHGCPEHWNDPNKVAERSTDRRDVPITLPKLKFMEDAE